MKGKTSELKTLEMNLLNYKEDRETTGKELDAVLAYLDKLKPQCETKAHHFSWEAKEGIAYVQVLTSPKAVERTKNCG